MTSEEFLRGVYREPDTGIWIVDGDTPIASEEELRKFYVNHVQQGQLTVHQSGGVDAKWTSTQQWNITYCISQSSLGSSYNTVVNAMNAAAYDWEAAATVNFVHASSQDGNCTNANDSVVFNVRLVNNGQYTARSFLPNYERAARELLIDVSAFGNNGPWTLTGILRHELGHALGFRHEHIRPEAGAATCFEDNGWRALTSYDSASVMHYPQCHGTQAGDLVLTQKDKEGAATLYRGNDGSVQVSSASTTAVADQGWQVGAVADMNKDGTPDLVWRNYSSGKQIIWYMSGADGATKGSSTVLADFVPDPAWRLEAAADMNKDGTPDLIWRNYTTGKNTVWYMSGASGATHVTTKVLTLVDNPDWKISGAADMNKDGTPDLVWRNYATGKQIIWYMSGADGATKGSSAVLSNFVPDPAWRLEAVADSNRDGTPDFIWRNYTTGDNQIWYMGGAGGDVVLTWTTLAPVASLNLHIQGAGDFDKDGMVDLFWRRTAGSVGDNSIWYMR